MICRSSLPRLHYFVLLIIPDRGLSSGAVKDFSSAHTKEVWKAMRLAPCILRTISCNPCMVFLVVQYNLLSTIPFIRPSVS